MSQVNYVTQEGLDRLKAELQHLKSTERSSISLQIREAREQGDLSENAEYDAAKEAQGMLELKISKLEEAIGNSRVISESDVDTSRVSVLANVKLKNLKNGKELAYKLVSEKEADLKTGKISVTSPIGKGLLGKTVGEVASIKVPAGVIELEVLDISI